MPAGQGSHCVTARGETQDLKIPVWMLEPECAGAEIVPTPTLDLAALRAVLSLAETCAPLITKP